MHTVIVQIVIVLAIGVAIFGTTELGFRIGRRFRKDSDVHAPIGAVQGGSLGLLGLLLGFAFSGASTRFIERQDILVAEANAIGTAYLRADLLPEPSRGALKDELRSYLDARISLFDEIEADAVEAIDARLEAHNLAIWKFAAEAVRARPEIANSVLPPINDVIDLLATRNAAAMRHLPLEVLLLLIGSAAISMGVIGYGAGAAGKRHASIVGALGILIVVALWVTIDLDYPRAGFIRMNKQALVDLSKSLAQSEKKLSPASGL